MQKHCKHEHQTRACLRYRRAPRGQRAVPGLAAAVELVGVGARVRARHADAAELARESVARNVRKRARPLDGDVLGGRRSREAVRGFGGGRREHARAQDHEERKDSLHIVPVPKRYIYTPARALQVNVMCAVGEKLIKFPDNCGVVDFSVQPRDETQEYDYPEIVIRFSTEFFANPEFIANWDAWKPGWLGWLEKEFSSGWFIVKAPGVANWCAECNVMQALPCFQFRCAACDNKHWEKYMFVDAFYEWRQLIDHTRDYDSRNDEENDSDRGCDWDRRSWDSDATYIPWRGCHMQD